MEPSPAAGVPKKYGRQKILRPNFQPVRPHELHQYGNRMHLFVQALHIHGEWSLSGDSGGIPAPMRDPRSVHR